MASKLPKHGFTLIEVLISLGLLSLIMALLYNALFSMTQSSQATNKKIRLLDDTRITRTFIYQQLSQIIPLSKRQGTELNIFFKGYSTKIMYVGKLPAHRTESGLHFLELFLDQNKHEILLFDIPARPDTSFERTGNNKQWRESLLLDNVKEMTFSYFGQQARTQEARWYDTWDYPELLPKLIKIDLLNSEGGDWYPLVIPLTYLSVTGQSQWVW